MPEEFTKLEQKFVIRCKECGHMFLPWKAFMDVKPDNGMRPYLHCPNCGNYADMDEFKII